MGRTALRGGELPLVQRLCQPQLFALACVSPKFMLSVVSEVTLPSLIACVWYKPMSVCCGKKAVKVSLYIYFIALAAAVQ